MLGEAKKRKINTRGEDLLLQLLVTEEDITAVVGDVTSEAGKELIVMYRGANEGTAGHYNELQHLESEILIY